MAHSFSLPLVAADILLAQLGLGRSPFPFDIPHIGTTQSQRAQVREAVFYDLEKRGLARGGQPDPELRTAVELFVRAPLVVGLVGKIDDDEEIHARAVSDRQTGLLVRQKDNELVFTEVRPTNFVAELVDLLPLTKPAPGQSITVPSRPPRRTTGGGGEGYDPFQGVQAPRSAQNSAQDRAVARLFEKPMKRVGFLTAFVPGTDGAPTKLDPVMWFDNDDGRHMGAQRSADDGQIWATYAPADNARIVTQLYTQLEPYL